MHLVKRERPHVIFYFPGEGIRQPSESPYRHAHGWVLPLYVASRDVFRIGTARNPDFTAPGTKGRFMKKGSRKHAKEIAALAALRDDKIDLTDLPEVLDWSGGVVGKYYRPIKKSLTIRLDADVLAWLKAQGRG
jgi:uncharacterized protein (DUF4415 family)